MFQQDYAAANLLPHARGLVREPTNLILQMKGTKMKNILFTSLAGGGALACAALALAGTTTAAPSGPSPAGAVISQLAAQGFNVIVSRVGTTAADCTVSGVRPGQTFSRIDSGAPGAQDDIVNTVTNKTVYVNLAC
jgi:hypothetical protein